MPSRFVLSLAEPDEVKEYFAATSYNGHDRALYGLGDTAMGRAERARAVGYDHIHLSRAAGTDLVQWQGRAPSEFFHEIGRVMRLHRLADEDG